MTHLICKCSISGRRYMQSQGFCSVSPSDQESRVTWYCARRSDATRVPTMLFTIYSLSQLFPLSLVFVALVGVELRALMPTSLESLLFSSLSCACARVFSLGWLPSGRVTALGSANLLRLPQCMLGMCLEWVLFVSCLGWTHTIERFCALVLCMKNQTWLQYVFVKHWSHLCPLFSSWIHIISIFTVSVN